MAVFKRSGSPYYYTDFVVLGKRIQESTKTTKKTVAREIERKRKEELLDAVNGIQPARRANRIQSVSDVANRYIERFPLNHRPKSVESAEGRLAHIKRLLGTTLLADLTEDVLYGYIRTRSREGASGRTLNMEIAMLSRAIGKPWKMLWPGLRKLEEGKDVGRALGPEEETSLIAALQEVRSPIISTVVRIALLTGMRQGEILSLIWGQIDFAKNTLTVGTAKTAAGTGRVIPLNKDLRLLLDAHSDWYKQQFGGLNASWYLFPFGTPYPSDPTRQITTIKHAWETLREKAGVSCRFHDLRHTAITKLAESGASEGTIMALAGHVSRSMLERYSHIRMNAKREAVEALRLTIPEQIPAKVPAIAPPALVQ